MGKLRRSIIQIGSMPFEISYIGGTGNNSVVLTELDTSTTTLAATPATAGLWPVGRADGDCYRTAGFAHADRLGPVLQRHDVARARRSRSRAERLVWTSSTLPVAANSITAQYLGDSQLRRQQLVAGHDRDGGASHNIDHAWCRLDDDTGVRGRSSRYRPRSRLSARARALRRERSSSSTEPRHAGHGDSDQRRRRRRRNHAGAWCELDHGGVFGRYQLHGPDVEPIDSECRASLDDHGRDDGLRASPVVRAKCHPDGNHLGGLARRGHADRNDPVLPGNHRSRYGNLSSGSASHYH